MKLTYHPRVQDDLDEAVDYYLGIPADLADDFWDEVMNAFDEIAEHPTRHHFHASGLRRKNLEKFPYHILYEILPKRVRIVVIRHDRRNPSFGLRRQ